MSDHFAGEFGMVDQIIQLAGILLLVEELFTVLAGAETNIFVASGADHAGFWLHRFRNHKLTPRNRFPRHQRPEAPTFERGGSGDAGVVEEGRHQIQSTDQMLAVHAG